MLACLLANILCDICKYSFMFFVNFFRKSIANKIYKQIIGVAFLQFQKKQTAS